MDNNSQSVLDRTLAALGPEETRRGFGALAVGAPGRARALLSEEGLSFPAFFTVLPEVRDRGLLGELDPKLQAAAGLCRHKLGGTAPEDGENGPEALGEGEHEAVLRWMFETGVGFDEAGDDAFGAVLDYTAALLVVHHEDAALLRALAPLLFSRNRRGRPLHDLAWVFYQTLDREALLYVAAQLGSDDSRDVALAAKLLGLELPESRDERLVLRDNVGAWLEENSPYLYVTGEHLQQTSSPMPLAADQEAKYLGKALYHRRCSPLVPLSDRENASLTAYRGATTEEQALLTDYSHKLRRTDEAAWQTWMAGETAQQVLAAQGEAELL